MTAAGVVEAGNNQASVGAQDLTIALASSPQDCHAKVPPAPIRTAKIKRANLRSARRPPIVFFQ
jgi:hypothetical protein